MSSNLPPGVNEGMLPGNRQEDTEYERWLDHLGDIGQKMFDAHEPHRDQLECLMGAIEFFRADVDVPPAIDQKLEDLFADLHEWGMDRNSPQD